MNKTPLSIKDSSIAFISSFIICQLAVIIVSMLVLVFASIFKVSDIEVFLYSSVGCLLMNSTMYITMFLVFLFFSKNKENKIIEKPKLNKSLIYVLIAIASFFMLYPIVNCVDSLLIKLGVEINTISYELTTPNYFISLLSMVILPAVCEELLFRGIIFKGLKSGGKNFAIILSSFMFAIYHMSLTQTIYPILFGLLLALVMFKENNIFYCMLMHLTNNFLALTISYFKWNLMFNHWTYILLAIVLVIIYVGLLIIFIKKQKNEENTQEITKTNLIFLISALAIMLILWIISNINI